MPTYTDTARESLHVFFPHLSTVSVVVHDHRVTRSGRTATRVSVLAVQDGTIRNVTGMVATATALPATRPTVATTTTLTVSTPAPELRTARDHVALLAALLSDALYGTPLNLSADVVSYAL